MKSTLRDPNVTPTAVQDVESSNSSGHFILYPSPSVGKLVIEFRHFKKGVGELEILNLQGQKVKEEQLKVTVGNNYHEVLTHDLPSALYFVKLKLPEESEYKVKKVIVKN